jgi:hypothetical protein
LTIFKEKEMPEFRKWILALAVVALFAGVASAQIGTPGTTPAGNFTCNTTPNGSVTPTVRGDGFTELVGDIVITCTGGTPLTNGTVIPTANITVFLNTAATSRLLSTSATAGAYTVSEATLLIDEPGSGLTGYGPSQPVTLCTSPAFGAGVGGCSQIVGAPVATSNGLQIPLNANGSAPAANAFQGLVLGNQIAFFGIPILPPTTTGVSRVLRITNIRANANGIGGTPGSVVASISTTISTIPSATATVGFILPGLSPTNTTVRNAANNGSGGSTSFAQCSNSSLTSGTTSASGGGLQFQENFATAFKTRGAPSTGTSGTTVQNIPGTVYNTESGFTIPAATSTGGVGATVYAAGFADYGTRLKATFSNVPSGVTLYVSTRDLTNSYLSYTNSAIGAGPNAVLVISETATDGGSTNFTVPTASPTTTFTGSGSAFNIPVAPLTVSAGTGQAVWEIIQANPSTIDTNFFGVYISYTASPATNVPTPGTMSVTLSFAPTPLGGAFTATTGSAASATLTIPRFSDSNDITKTYATFALCTTDLLYPYVVNVNGFDTGLAIANTTTDPFGTTPQAGTCTLNFYGTAAPTAAFTTPNVATGTVYANLASTLAPGFDGYMIAVCNFQYAHGFAFISDVGARNLAMGYLALVMNGAGSLNTRGSTAENFNQ